MESNKNAALLRELLGADTEEVEVRVPPAEGEEGEDKVYKFVLTAPTAVEVAAIRVKYEDVTDPRISLELIEACLGAKLPGNWVINDDPTIPLLLAVYRLCGMPDVARTVEEKMEGIEKTRLEQAAEKGVVLGDAASGTQEDDDEGSSTDPLS